MPIKMVAAKKNQKAIFFSDCVHTNSTSDNSKFSGVVFIKKGRLKNNIPTAPIE
jgi:hypothetical protein